MKSEAWMTETGLDELIPVIIEMAGRLISAR
jgi:hypothetical protein